MTDFSDAERAAVYRVIAARRDVRGQFTPRPVPREVLRRVLAAAHLAPSVGFSQPWDFVVIEDSELRKQVKADFDRQKAATAELYDGPRQDVYRGLKLEGILDAPLNVCVTCDRGRGGPHVLGRHTAVDADLFSVCLAVQNLWLAARAEGLGVGWVSILDHPALARLLGLPPAVVPVAYLCVGYADHFAPVPDLEAAGWASRDPWPAGSTPTAGGAGWSARGPAPTGTDTPMGDPHTRLVEGIDYTVEGGRWVFTAAYHRRRGYCCQNGCRHCPFGNTPADRPNPAADDTPRPNKEGSCPPN